MVSYDAFAETFSNSRKNMQWAELDAIIEDIRANGYTSVLDVGCGNGRLLEQLRKSNYELGMYLGIDASSGMIAEARKLHPEYEFEVCSMESLTNFEFGILNFESIVFLASFHHLETREARIDTLNQAKHLLAPNGRIYMTNWNLAGQPKYEKSHRGNGDFDIKIGEHIRYYHGFTVEELAGLFEEVGLKVVENRVFEGGRNMYSVITNKE